MSFEFKGAIVARDLLLKLGGVEDQADSICDAIIRHQDIFVKGYVRHCNAVTFFILNVHSGKWEHYHDWTTAAIGNYPW